MEISSTQKVPGGHLKSFRDKCRLSKAEREQKYHEVCWRKGSIILPDFFPPDAQPKKSVNQNMALFRLVKQYSWEKEGEFEAKAIAESWMIYFGLERCDFRKKCV